MICPKCGQSIDDSALICPNCSYPIKKKTVNEMLVEQMQHKQLAGSNMNQQNSHSKGFDLADERNLTAKAASVHTLAVILLIAHIIAFLVFIILTISEGEDWFFGIAVASLILGIVLFMLLSALESRMRVLANISTTLKEFNFPTR